MRASTNAGPVGALESTHQGKDDFGFTVLSPIVTHLLEGSAVSLNLRRYVERLADIYAVMGYQMKDQCHYSEMLQWMLWLSQIFGSLKGCERSDNFLRT